MKKTLIALAALAATGAAFAQATISGNLGLSWQQNPLVSQADGSHVQGLSMNDGEIYIAATEDLGGGTSATARGGFTMRGRGTAILDRDATLSIKGSFGALTGGSLRSCGSMVTVQSGAVTGTQYTANESSNYLPLDKCSMVDTIYFSVPVGPVLFTATYGEFAAGATYNSATGGYWLDSKGNVNGITFTDLDGTYNQGPLMVRMNVTTFSTTMNKSDSATAALAPYGANGVVAVDGMIRTRLVGTYDIGVAKFGMGYQNRTMGLADQYVASVAVPYGNSLFGVDYTARAGQGPIDKGQAGAVAAYVLGASRDGDKASSSLGLGWTYNFSKTTNLNVSYITYTDAGANTKYGTASTTAFTYAGITGAGSTPALLDTEYRVRLLKSF